MSETDGSRTITDSVSAIFIYLTNELRTLFDSKLDTEKA